VRLRLLLLAAAIGAAVPTLAADTPANKEGVYRLTWPHLLLHSENGERVTSFEIKLACGRFRGIVNIPDDWSLKVVSPVSEVTSLHAEAGHGTSSLWSLQPFDGSIKIEIAGPECFDISAQVTAEGVTADGSETKRQFRFKRKDLQLR
jgi:hypothetical protein